MRTALILGIGPAQADAIRLLKDQGWSVIGCSNSASGPGLSLVDRFELVDIRDAEALQALAIAAGIDMIYSVGSDVAMPSVARVATGLGLRSFVSEATATLLQNKLLLRSFLAAEGISPVRYRRISGCDDLAKWSHFPAIVKPSDSQGQRGVSLVGSRWEAGEAMHTALRFSQSGCAIIEEYLDGPEISANVFVHDGDVVVSEVSDRLVAAGYPGGIPRGHIMPARCCADAVLRETQTLIERCVRALAIQNGPVYFQLKLTAGGPRVIEIAARLDGCHLWRLLQITRGVDLLRASLAWLAGDSVNEFSSVSLGRAARLMYFLAPPRSVFHRAEHVPPEQAVHAEYFLEEGQAVRAVNGHLEKVGYYIEAAAS